MNGGLVMKAVFALFAALFLCVANAQPVDAQTRTVRHPAPTGQALTIDLPGGWSANPDADNNLIVTSPESTVAFSLSLVPDDQGYTLEQFAREALGVAKATGITSPGVGLIPPYIGDTYLAKMTIEGQVLSLKMLIAKADEDKIASATMITATVATAEQLAVGEMILKTIRVVR